MKDSDESDRIQDKKQESWETRQARLKEQDRKLLEFALRVLKKREARRRELLNAPVASDWKM
jgi:hypothetical protein